MADPRPTWLNPQMPVDPEPVHWRKRTVAECGVTGAAAASLIAAGLTQLGPIADALEAGTFPKLRGVAAGTMDKLRASVRAWRDGE